MVEKSVVKLRRICTLKHVCFNFRPALHYRNERKPRNFALQNFRLATENACNSSIVRIQRKSANWLLNDCRSENPAILTLWHYLSTTHKNQLIASRLEIWKSRLFSWCPIWNTPLPFFISRHFVSFISHNHKHSWQFKNAIQLTSSGFSQNLYFCIIKTANNQFNFQSMQEQQKLRYTQVLNFHRLPYSELIIVMVNSTFLKRYS